MSAPWNEELRFLPASAARLSDALHANGFTLDSSTYYYAHFGSRDVRFRHPHGKMWLWLWYEGKEGDWGVSMAVAEGRELPQAWIEGGQWLMWAALCDDAENVDVIEVLAANLRAVVNAAAGRPPADVRREVAAAQRREAA